MKLQRIGCILALSVGGWVTAAAPETALRAVVPAVEKSVEVLVQQLADPQFATRETASLLLWKMGQTALPSLQKIAAGNDPEQAYRARELVRKIQLYVTPDTDPEIVRLIERWQQASSEEKVKSFTKLNAKRAWRQILRLYAGETDPDLRLRLLQPLQDQRNIRQAQGISQVAVTGAREELAAGRPQAAREYLEMAPADAQSLLALADFHRSQGTLAAELKRALTLQGRQADAWQLALHRASGNLDAARTSALAAGEMKIAALMAGLHGDPLPWLQQQVSEREDQQTKVAYSDIAIRRWQGKPIRKSDLEPLELSANSPNRHEHDQAAKMLFLLGEPTVAEVAWSKNSPVAAFDYLEAQERVLEALTLLGLDPEKPDYTAWVRKRFEQVAPEAEEDDQPASADSLELVNFARFMERRGLTAECEAAYLEPLAALAKQNLPAFTELLRLLFHGVRTQMEAPGAAPELAMKVAIDWAGEDADRWEKVVSILCGEVDEFTNLWDWMGKLEPATSRAERFRGLMAVAGLGRDPQQLRTKWLGLAWAEVDRLPTDEQAPALEKVRLLVNFVPDATSSLRLWDRLLKDTRKNLLNDTHIYMLSAAGRWSEVVEICADQIAAMVKAKQEPQPALHAYLAACLRKMGRTADAAREDAWTEKLALGHNATGIASGYLFGADYPRAAEWFARAARQCDPEDAGELLPVLKAHQAMLIQAGKWSQVAAVSEIIAHSMAAVESGITAPQIALRLRLQADLGRGLARLKDDRAGSIALLAQCHQWFPTDGSLADDFFPALRQAGLMKEHDAWFEDSWARMLAVIARFPDSANTCNTTAWLASRARRNLDQAEKLEQKVLAAFPDQPAYLDTMAEIQFAKGNRRQALEWSARAVNFMPMDQQLRTQNDRFRSAPLPK